MPTNKSLGPDGFIAEFYIASWGIIGVQVIAAVQEFFYSGTLLKEFNATVITLVPKCQAPNKGISGLYPIAIPFTNVLLRSWLIWFRDV